MEIYTDGGEEKYCFVIPERNVVKIFEKKNITNNESEYLAVIEALKFVEENSKVKVFSDSKLIVNQIKMEWHIWNNVSRIIRSHGNGSHAQVWHDRRTDGNGCGEKPS